MSKASGPYFGLVLYAFGPLTSCGTARKDAGQIGSSPFDPLMISLNAALSTKAARGLVILQAFVAGVGRMELIPLSNI